MALSAKLHAPAALAPRNESPYPQNRTEKDAPTVRVPKMARGIHSRPNFISFSRPASLYFEEYVYICSGVCHNERCYNEHLFINKIRILQRTQMLQRKRRITTGRRSMRVRMKCRVFSLWLVRQLSSLLSIVSYSYQFSLVICFSYLHVQCIKIK